MTALASIAELVSFLSSASVEISSHGHQLKELCDNFAVGTTVTIVFLPGDNYRHNVETAAVLRRLGFNPLPHIAARELASHEALYDFLTRLRGEADVKRVLLIAGDVVAAKGPYRSSRDMAMSGLLLRRPGSGIYWWPRIEREFLVIPPPLARSVLRFVPRFCAPLLLPMIVSVDLCRKHLI
jgi:hypothetical protein